MNRQGAFAERVNAPIRCLLPWPENLTAEEACLAEPLGNGVHVARLTAHLPCETALVIGAGPIGLFCQQALQIARGTRVLVADFSEERLAVARRLGAVRTIRAEVEDPAVIARAFTEGEGVDVVVDAVGTASTKRNAIDAARPGGATVWIGLHDNSMTLDSFAVTLPEKKVLGTYAAKLDDLRQALEWLRSGKVDAKTWTTRLPLVEAEQAFRRALAGKGSDIKMIVAP